jgi:hypothetical protein
VIKKKGKREREKERERETKKEKELNFACLACVSLIVVRIGCVQIVSNAFFFATEQMALTI